MISQCKALSLLAALTATTYLPVNLSAMDDLMLYDFREEKSGGGWVAVNDGVMGGISQGGPKMLDQAMLFSGDLSLENNGGFSSIRKRAEHDLSGYDGIRLRVKGDGRTYQLRLQTDARLRNNFNWPVSFSGEFETKAGEWVVVDVPFSDLRQSFRGRKLTSHTFDEQRIELLGILLADKQPGPFAIELEWIKAYRKSQPSDSK